LRSEIDNLTADVNSGVIIGRAGGRYITGDLAEIVHIRPDKTFTGCDLGKGISRRSRSTLQVVAEDRGRMVLQVRSLSG